MQIRPVEKGLVHSKGAVSASQHCLLGTMHFDTCVCTLGSSVAGDQLDKDRGTDILLT